MCESNDWLMCDSNERIVYGPRRKYIRELKEFTDDAMALVEPLFGDLEAYFSKVGSEYWDNHYPMLTEDDCPGDLAEQATDHAIERSFARERMRQDVLLALITSQYHQWEKQLAEWFDRRFQLYRVSEDFLMESRKYNFKKRIDLLEQCQWPVRKSELFPILEKQRLVVNCYKHGAGWSFDELKKRHPEAFKNYRKPDCMSQTLPERLCLDLAPRDLKIFGENLQRFWTEMLKWEQEMTAKKTSNSS